MSTKQEGKVEKIDLYKQAIAEPKKKVHSTAVTDDYPGPYYKDREG